MNSDGLAWQHAIERNGFAGASNVFSQQEISRLVNDFNAATLTRSRAGVRHAMACPVVAAVARDDRMLALARPALGANAIPFRATLFDKSPESNWLVVWHQDTALPLKQRQEMPGWGPWSVKDSVIYARAPASALNRILALRLHLDDSTTENGPLRILPATHNLGVLTDDAIHDLAGKRLHVDCLVSQGGVLAMRPLLVHASSKSRVQALRRVLHIEYAASTTLTEGAELAVA